MSHQETQPFWIWWNRLVPGVVCAITVIAILAWPSHSHPKPSSATYTEFKITTATGCWFYTASYRIVGDNIEFDAYKIEGINSAEKCRMHVVMDTITIKDIQTSQVPK